MRTHSSEIKHLCSLYVSHCTQVFNIIPVHFCGIVDLISQQSIAGVQSTLSISQALLFPTTPQMDWIQVHLIPNLTSVFSNYNLYLSRQWNQHYKGAGQTQHWHTEWMGLSTLPPQDKYNTHAPEDSPRHQEMIWQYCNTAGALLWPALTRILKETASIPAEAVQLCHSIANTTLKTKVCQLRSMHSYTKMWPCKLHPNTPLLGWLPKKEMCWTKNSVIHADKLYRDDRD